MRTCLARRQHASRVLAFANSFFWGGPAMDGDLIDLEGLFQEEADVAALRALWSYLEPADRLALLAVSWYLSTGFHRLLILLAVRGYFP